MLQWEWLGGLPPLRRAAVIGAGADGAALAAMLTRAGVQVDRGAVGDLSAHDLVAFAVPAEQLPAALERHGAAIPERAGVLVLSRGMVPPRARAPLGATSRRAPPPGRSAPRATRRPRWTAPGRSCSPPPTPPSAARSPTR